MAIYPLPQFEADVAEALREEEDRRAYAALQAPKSLVVRFGYLKMVGEFPYDGAVKPGCGSKLVVRSPRGTELGEMLTSTCPNSGCSKSVSRKEMLTYIENSGGRDYPFFTQGRVLRVATREDMDAQARLEQKANEWRLLARSRAQELNLPVKIVQAEPVLGGERVTFYYLSEDQHARADFSVLGGELQKAVGTRVEFRPVGARDEARLNADYEKCGQYCCCKNFLKVLKPVSMRSAKEQKGTLDPLKISGRCGRLMCCLRYEDETYASLKKRLPHRKTRVLTPEGPGIVLDTQILTQLALVLLDAPGEGGKEKRIAVPVEELQVLSGQAPPQPRAAGPRPASGPAERSEPHATNQSDSEPGVTGGRRRRRRKRRGGGPGNSGGPPVG